MPKFNGKVNGAFIPNNFNIFRIKKTLDLLLAGSVDVSQIVLAVEELESDAATLRDFIISLQTQITSLELRIADLEN